MAAKWPRGLGEEAFRTVAFELPLAPSGSCCPVCWTAGAPLQLRVTLTSSLFSRVVARTRLPFRSLVRRYPHHSRQIGFRLLLGHPGQVASISTRLSPICVLRLQNSSCRLLVARESHGRLIGQIRPLSPDPAGAARRAGEFTRDDAPHLREEKLRCRRVTLPHAEFLAGAESVSAALLNSAPGSDHGSVVSSGRLILLRTSIRKRSSEIPATP